MTWHHRYQLKEFAKSSFWLYPSLALVIAWLLAKSILWLVQDPEWPRFIQADLEGVRVSMAAFASSMLTFIVYAVSALLLAAQLASGQTTPRLIRLTFSRWEMKVSTSLFVFAFGITMVALANLTPAFQHSLLILLAILANVGSILVFFWFVQEVGLGLRLEDAKEALDSVYEGTHDPDVPEGSAASRPVEPEGRILHRIGSSGTFLAFGSHDLMVIATSRAARSS